MAVLYHVLLVVSLTCHVTRAILPQNILVPNLPDKSYHQNGDVILGGLFPIQGFSSTTPCGSRLRNEGIVQYMEAMVFAIERENRDSTILPNVTIGFTILDTCVKESTALAQALKFVPRQEETSGAYRVAGVIGPMKSSNTIEVSTLLGQFGIPQLSYASSSDSLSDTKRFPNFFRTVPPDQFQVRTMMAILNHFNWTYISVIHSDDVYGLDAMKSIEKLSRGAGVCIGYQKGSNEWLTDEDYDSMIRQLKNAHAHAVILFMGPTPTRKLLMAARRQNIENEFTWIGSDAWASRVQQFTGLESITSGAILVKPISVQIQQFQDYFVELNPENRKSNPWFDEFWKMHFQCETVCPDNLTLSKDSVHFMSSLAPIVDAVQALALAVDRQTNRACPSGVNAQNFYSCYDGQLVAAELLRTDFEGEQGQVVFNQEGDYLGSYVIEQYQKQGEQYRSVKLAVWNARSDSIQFTGQPYQFYNQQIQTSQIPDSVCSRECRAGEFKVQLELKCCWECRKCRVNEIVTDNGTDCRACPLHFWPDQETFKYCEPIQPSYITITSTVGIALASVAGTGMLATVLTAAFYIRHNDKRLIKASSRELSCIMLVGIFLGYLTTIGFLLTPTDTWCHAIYAGFCLGFVWIYSPLLVKTNRILRIFNAGKRGKKSPKLIGSGVQMVITACLILIQIGITVSSSSLLPPKAEVHQPAINRRYVELSCYIPSEGMMTFATYNLLLVVLCSVHAFFSRKLPDNFNEAKFITMCVYATLITWIAFVPTYFTTAQPYYRIVLLGMSLLLNDSLALMFLFWPKVYAVLFVGEDGQKVSYTGMANNTTRSVNDKNDQTITGKSGASRTEPSKFDSIGEHTVDQE